MMCEVRQLMMPCFCTLLQLGYEGFLALIDLAQRDVANTQSFILQNLLSVRAI